MVNRVDQQFGNYRLLRQIGKGGFADVYLGEHIHLGTQAAVKVLHTQVANDDIEAFRSEARTIAQLEHPNIVRVFEFDIKDGTPFLIMSYAPNGNLRQRHMKGVPLPPSTAEFYIKQIADALQYAHDSKLIHRDIKPENILLGRRNEVLLSDFGIALIAQSTSSQSIQDVAGTIHYMAPEQIRGKPRPASDQYALGVMTYEWLCGYRPFYGSFTEIATQHMFEPPPPLHEKNPNVTPDIERVVMTALAKEPQQRFVSIQAFATALEQAYSSPAQHSPTAPQYSLDTVPGQPLPQAAVTASPTQQPWATIATPPSNQSAQPDTIPTLTTTPPPLKREISRRTLLAGTAGLTLAGVGVTGLIWFTRSKSSHVPISTSTPTPTSSTDPTPSGLPLGTILRTYHGHTAEIYSLAWSSDSKYIASSSGDTTVQTWDASLGNNLAIYRGHSAFVRSVAWLPNGSHIASASDDHTVQISDSFTAENIFTYRGHSAPANAVSWSPDGKRMASGSGFPGEADHTVHVWDTSHGNTMLIYRGHSDVVRAVSWSPDGRYLASGGHDNTVQVWNANNGTTILSYKDHSNRVTSVRWSSNGTQIVSGCDDQTVQVWDAFHGNTLFIYRGHSGAVEDVAWSPTGHRIASASYDHTVQVWDATTGGNIFIYRGHPSWVQAVAWSPNGARIASGSYDKSVQVWQAL